MSTDEVTGLRGAGPTDEQIMALAREVFPDLSPGIKSIYSLMSEAKYAEHHPRFRQAFYLALLVMRGEPSGLDEGRIMAEAMHTNDLRRLMYGALVEAGDDDQTARERASIVGCRIRHARALKGRPE